MEGKVKFFDELKGFGFIIGDDDKEYFVHISGLECNNLKEDERVTFKTEKGERGIKAVEVGRLPEPGE